MKPLGGLVLCGGASRRMGRDKALLPIDGVPLVIRMAQRLSGVADPVVLAPGWPGRFGDLGYPEVADAAPGGGPLAGLVAGLAASVHDLVAVVAVDMPDASPALFRLMAELHRDEDAVVPVDDRGPQPLHAVFARTSHWALGSALAEGRLRVVDALSRLRVREVADREWRAADPSGRFATNVNVPEDLADNRSISSSGAHRASGARPVRSEEGEDDGRE